jgi:hypothetical protein
MDALAKTTILSSSTPPHDLRGSASEGLSDLELLPDATIVATTHLRYAPDPEKHSVVCTRLKQEERDALLAKEAAR